MSLLLIWVSFVDSSFAWLSWPTYAMVGGSLLLLALAVLVESRAAEPVVPLSIVRERTTALAIVASLAVGMAMFGGAVFLGQYFQIGRGYSPTQAGLLTIPLMAGVLISSVVAGRLISRTGRIKPYVMVGTVVLVAGFVLLSFLRPRHPAVVRRARHVRRRHRGRDEHAEPRARGAEHRAAAGHRCGQRVGRVLPLARRRDRGLGARRRAGPPGGRLHHRQLAAAGAPASGGSGDLDVAALPAAMQQIVRTAYGDATGHIFLISAAIAVVGVVAAALLRPKPLRTSLDLDDQPEPVAVDAGGPAEAVTVGGPGRALVAEPAR